MASEGRNKAAKSLLDLQPTAVLELFLLYPDFKNEPSKFYTFHPGSVFKNPVVWNGLQYMPLSVDTEGFGIFGDGTLPRPKMRIANTDKIITVLLQQYSDLKNAVIYRKKVFVKHLDDANFDGGNPFGVADGNAEITEEKYLIGQKVLENFNYVEFELNLPTDLDNFDVNQRTVNAKYCYWQYRGLGCGYQGKPVETATAEPFKDPNGNIVPVDLQDDFNTSRFEYNANNQYFVARNGDDNKLTACYIENKKLTIDRDKNGLPIYFRTWYVCVQAHSSTNPQFPEGNPSYWQQDNCSKSIQSCKRRFSETKTYQKFIGAASQNLKYVSFKERSESSPVGIQFASAASLFTSANSVLTFQNSNAKAFSITFWLRNTKSQDSIKTIFSSSYDGQINRVQNTTKKTSPLYYYQKGVKNVLSESFGEETRKENVFGFASIVWNKEQLIHSWNDTVKQKAQGVVSTSDNTPDFFSLFELQQIGTAPRHNVSFMGDIAQVCVWDRALTTDELTKLRKTNVSRDAPFKDVFMPLEYSQCTGELATLTGEAGAGGLVAWYDMNTGALGSETGLLDSSSHNLHLTGYGDLRSDNFETVSYINETTDFVESTQEYFFLPFGGFPGTDGYDYNPRPSQQ